MKTSFAMSAYDPKRTLIPYRAAMLAHLSAIDCVMTVTSPNHVGCFRMAVVPIKANNRQMTLICNIK
jgi:hypothetical protein